MYRIYFWADKRRKTAAGYPVRLVVSWEKNQKFISTGLYTNTELVNGKFARTEANSMLKNMTLAKIEEKVGGALLTLGERRISADAVKRLAEEAINGRTAKRFLDYIDEYIETIPVVSTKTTYRTMRNKVEEYDRKVMLEEVTVGWLTDFENWMIRQNYGVNYYGQIERSIRKVFNYCIDKEYTEQYPFRRFKCKSGKTANRNLTVEEVRSLRDWPCEKWQEEYRDMFMLQIYMLGIDAVDLFNMPAIKNLQPGCRIAYKRQKIGRKDAGYVAFSLCQEAYDIIMKYKGTDHLLNILDGRYKNYKDYLHHMNDGLKKIGKVNKLTSRQVDKEPLTKVSGTERGARSSWKIEYEAEFPGLTSKWSRHTWATLAAKAGVGRDIIGLALGHSDDSVTSIYIEYDQIKRSDEANAKVISLIHNS